MALLTCSDVTFSDEGIPVLTYVNFTLEAGSYLCIVCLLYTSRCV